LIASSALPIPGQVETLAMAGPMPSWEALQGAIAGEAARRIAIVSQPRCTGANEHTTAAVARDVRDRLERAGFDCLRTETLMLKSPVA